jgi:hypothetical protein
VFGVKNPLTYSTGGEYNDFNNDGQRPATGTKTQDQQEAAKVLTQVTLFNIVNMTFPIDLDS